MHPEFIDKLKNLEALYEGKSWKDILRIKHDMVSEFLNHRDEAVEPISRILVDSSSSFSTLDLALSMAELVDEERLVPCLIQFLEENKDKDEKEDLCERVSNILYGYGEFAARHVVKKLEENFEKKIYNGWLVDALRGAIGAEFVEKILNDFLTNRSHYENWFNLGHFAWGLMDVKEMGGRPPRLVEKLLEQKNLYREDKLELKRLHKFMTDEESYQKEENEEEKREETFMDKLILTGMLHSKLSEFVPDGPRPMIDDDNLEEYLPLLYSIELIIYSYYNAHPSLKDSDVIRLLKNVRDGIWKDYEGKDEFEKSFITWLKISVFNLTDLHYTKNEISACISRVLNSVKRHRGSGGERGYLDFIKDFFRGGELTRKNPSGRKLVSWTKRG